MSYERGDNPSPLDAFLAQFWGDQDEGLTRELSEYLHMFPGAEIAIAREFLDATQEGQRVADIQSSYIGPYRIVQEIGRGSQGVVFEAEDASLSRRVAVKVLTGINGLSPDDVERFRREATIVAGLQHPNICPVYRTGTAPGGVPWMAMQLVPGQTLAELIRKKRAGDPPTRFSDTTHLELDAMGSTVRSEHRRMGDDPGTDRARQAGVPDKEWEKSLLMLFEGVARAVHAAHSRRIIHRDIKPGNLMITPDDQPVVLDFGLARIDHEGQSFSQTRGLVGTPAYISPEQLDYRDGALAPDYRVDIWALGVSLYEALTLTLPFQANTREAMFNAIVNSDPVSPGRLCPQISKDLSRVVSMCLEKKPDRRYESAALLADDLKNVRLHRPVSARRVGLIGRLRRWSQREPALAWLTGISILLLLGGTFASTIFALRIQAQNEQLEESADRQHLSDLIAQSNDKLWPAVPEHGAAMSVWVEQAKQLSSRLPQYEARLRELRTHSVAHDEQDLSPRMTRLLAEQEDARNKIRLVRSELSQSPGSRMDPTHSVGLFPEFLAGNKTRDELSTLLTAYEAKESELANEIAGQGRWSFSTPERREAHHRLAEFVASLRAMGGPDSPRLATIAGMEARLELARRVEIEANAASDSWAAVRRRLADPTGSYGGISLESVQVHGLVPLGFDESSGLCEFWHVASGPRPEWIGTFDRGHVPLERFSGHEGMVFVLLPPGSFIMGGGLAAPRDSGRALEVDPHATHDEWPLENVRLGAVFVSKFEVTQAQWVRSWGENPSKYAVGYARKGAPVTGRHPVTDVSWHDANTAAKRWGLSLPTEAQWEYACRATVMSPYTYGSDRESIVNKANLADRRCAEAFDPEMPYEDYDDGHAIHAPVATYPPNRWGLFDMHGNVSEWCADEYVFYSEWPARGPRGQRRTYYYSDTRVYRGGGFQDPPIYLRSSYRFWNPATLQSAFLGFRPVLNLSPSP